MHLEAQLGPLFSTNYVCILTPLLLNFASSLNFTLLASQHWKHVCKKTYKPAPPETHLKLVSVPTATCNQCMADVRTYVGTHVCISFLKCCDVC